MDTFVSESDGANKSWLLGSHSTNAKIEIKSPCLRHEKKRRPLALWGRSEEASWAHQTMRVRAADGLVENPNESPEDVTTKTLAHLVA